MKNNSNFLSNKIIKSMLILINIALVLFVIQNFIQQKNAEKIGIHYLSENPYAKQNFENISYENEKYSYTIEEYLIRKKDFETLWHNGYQEKETIKNKTNKSIKDLKYSGGKFTQGSCQYFSLVFSHPETNLKFHVLERNCFDGKISIVYKKTIS